MVLKPNHWLKTREKTEYKRMFTADRETMRIAAKMTWIKAMIIMTAFFQWSLSECKQEESITVASTYARNEVSNRTGWVTLLTRQGRGHVSFVSIWICREWSSKTPIRSIDSPFFFVLVTLKLKRIAWSVLSLHRLEHKHSVTSFDYSLAWRRTSASISNTHVVIRSRGKDKTDAREQQQLDWKKQRKSLMQCVCIFRWFAESKKSKTQIGSCTKSKVLKNQRKLLGDLHCSSRIWRSLLLSLVAFASDAVAHASE